MKTKNIFRMLLVAVMLLLGANNAMAYTLTYKYTIERQNETVYKTYQLNEGDAIVPEDTPTMEGYSFSGWSYIPATMPGYDLNVTGNFSANSYTITANSTVNGSFSVNQSAKFGSEVTIYINPQNGYEVDEVTVTAADGSDVGVTVDYKFIMPAQDVTVTVTFKAQTFTLTWAIQGEDEPYLTQQLATGEAIVEPDPAPTKVGYSFNGWGQHEQTMPARDYTITGSFTVINYTITANATVNGTFSVNQSATYDSEVTIYINPHNGYEVDEVTVTAADGSNIDVTDDNKFTMPAQDVTVTVTFKAQTFTLTWAIQGEDEPYLTQQLATGEAIVEPDPAPAKVGYSFNGWWQHEQTMPARDYTITGSFTAINYTIAITPSEHGSLSAYRETAHYLDEITIYTQADWGYELEEGSITVVDADNHPIDVSSDLKFTMPASNVTISGTFVAIATSEKVRVNMSYTSSSVELTLGDEFTAPTLSIKDAEGNDVAGITITYSSSNEGLATVTSDGTVTLVEGATGSATITASFAGDATYEAASAQYTITVKKPQRQITPGENETIIWNGTPEPTHPGEWNLLIDNSTNWVANTKDNSKIRIYVDNQEESDWKLWAGTYGWQNANWANWPNSDEIRKNTEGTTPYNAEGMYFEFTFSESTKAAIANGLAISFWGQDIVMVTHITEPDAPTYEISAPKPDHGNITVNQSTAIEGASVTFTVKPDAGYRIESVTVTRTDNDETVSASGADGTYTFTMPASDVTVSATFTAISYTVTIEGVENGTVTADKATATIGETVSLTVTPDHGYELASIVVKDEANNRVNVAKDHSFTMPASNVTVTATFSKIGYKVNFEITGEGTVTADQNSYGEGETAWITATPETGYSLYTLTSSPSVEFTSYGNGRYSFTMPASPVTINATFTINTWTITYYVDGEFYHAESYDYGETITPLGNLADREDAHFSGWSDIPETMPDHDVSIYAYYSGFATAIINSSTGYASFSSVKPLDFSEVEGLKAYIVVDADVEGMVAHLKEVTGAIAAKTGLILKGTKDKYEIPTATTAATSYNNNMLVAVSSKQTFSNNSGVFLLVERNGVAMFAEANSGIEKSVEAGHAYLQVSNAGRAQGRYLRFVGDDTTGISDVKASLTSDEVIYNLRGQRVEKPNKGLYIINGKKVILK